MKIIFVILSIVLILAVNLMLAVTVLAADYKKDYDKGLKYYYQKDYSKALAKLEPLAKRGNPNAQGYMGLMYLNGYGVKQDYHEAMKWFLLAAEGGYTPAVYNLGYMYEKGFGTDKDVITAYAYYSIAAEGEIYEAREAITRIKHDMTVEQIGIAKDKAEQLLKEFGIIHHP